MKSAQQLTAQPGPGPGRQARPVGQRRQVALEEAVRAAEQRLQGRIGLAARQLETGLSIGVNADVRFPMASTYKVPLAGLLLSLVDAGRLTLDQRVEISARHLEETGEIAQSVLHPGIALSVMNLLELTLTQSNNNATDRLFELVGGPGAVTEWLRSLGLSGMRLDNSVNALLGKYYGLPPGAPSLTQFLAKWPDEADRERVNGQSSAEFDDGPEDSSTPAAMLDLLVALFDTDLLSPGSRDILLGVMSRCQTGPGRIRGLLPPGTPVAHKTGTIGGTINDVGLITLPGGRGRLALAIYSKGSRILRYLEREPILADVARSVFDLFALHD